MRALLLAAAASVASAAYLLSDANGVGRTFDGIGAISGGGATSRLLMDYPDTYRSQILDYLFTPQFGASLHILKTEIGSGVDTTNGAEASHMYNASDYNPLRGYEFPLAVEAVKRNPSVALYSLPWGFPAWVDPIKGTNGSPYDYEDGALTAAYTLRWLQAARDVFNLSYSYVGSWNEKGYNDGYLINLRELLDVNGFGALQIVASDQGGWPIAGDILNNASVAAAVYALGSHYPGSSASSQAQQTGKPLWASEDGSQNAEAGGGSCMARVLSENYVHGNITGTINWSLICSWLPGIQFWGDGLMIAVEPWSGAYSVEPPIWSLAHHTQFVQPAAYTYLQHGAGAGYLSGGGTYVTYVNKSDHTEFTLVIEKMPRDNSQCSWSGSPANTTTNETAVFQLGGALAAAAGKQLYVWYSAFGTAGRANVDAMFQKLAPITVGSDGSFTLSVAVGDLYTITTRGDLGNKGSHPAPPPSAPFPLPYSDSFANATLYQQPAYWCDMNGATEIQDSGDASHGLALRQMVPEKPILWLRQDTRPHTIIGNVSWKDVDASFDVRLDAPGDVIAIGVRTQGAGGEIDFMPGAWFSVNTAGQWNLTASIGNMTVTNAEEATGQLPAPPSLGSWHRLRAVAVGRTATFYYDGAPILANYTLPAKVPASGFVGMGTNYGCFVWMDNPAISVPA